MNTICQKCGCQTEPDQMNGVHCLVCVPVAVVGRTATFDSLGNYVTPFLRDDFVSPFPLPMLITTERIEVGQETIAGLTSGRVHAPPNLFSDTQIGTRHKNIPVKDVATNKIYLAELILVAVESDKCTLETCGPLKAWSGEHVDYLPTAATVKDDFEMFTELSLTNGSNAGSFLVTNGTPMNFGSVLSRFCDFGKSCAWEVNYVSASRLQDDENGWIEIKARVRNVGV